MMASNDSDASTKFGAFGDQNLLKSAEKGSPNLMFASAHNSGMRYSGDRSSGNISMSNTTTHMLSTSTNP